MDSPVENGEQINIRWLVGGLVAIFYFPIYIGNNHPNWLSYFSEGWPNHQPDDFFSGFNHPSCWWWCRMKYDEMPIYCEDVYKMEFLKMAADDLHYIAYWLFFGFWSRNVDAVLCKNVSVTRKQLIEFKHLRNQSNIHSVKDGWSIQSMHRCFVGYNICIYSIYINLIQVNCSMLDELETRKQEFSSVRMMFFNGNYLFLELHWRPFFVRNKCRYCAYRHEVSAEGM